MPLFLLETAFKHTLHHFFLLSFCCPLTGTIGINLFYRKIFLCKCNCPFGSELTYDQINCTNHANVIQLRLSGTRFQALKEKTAVFNRKRRFLWWTLTDLNR